MNKKGQFFLIATIVIAGIIIGLSLIQISTKAPKEERAIYDLSKQIGFESNKVIDYGVFNSVPENKLRENITSLLDYYATTASETDVMVVYGNENALKGFYYTETPGPQTGVSSGTATPMSEIDIAETGADITHYIKKSGDYINVYINENVSYEFELKPGEHFYIVLEKRKGDEKIVAANQ